MFIKGQNFDPKRRRFTEDELKPQPIIKKSRKVRTDCIAINDHFI